MAGFKQLFHGISRSDENCGPQPAVIRINAISVRLLECPESFKTPKDATIVVRLTCNESTIHTDGCAFAKCMVWDDQGAFEVRMADITVEVVLKGAERFKPDRTIGNFFVNAAQLTSDGKEGVCAKTYLSSMSDENPSLKSYILFSGLPFSSVIPQALLSQQKTILPSPRDITMVQITVEDRRKISIDLDISPSDTVGKLKAQIEEYTGHPIAQQRLEYVDEAMPPTLRPWYPTVLLQDDKTLEFYSISNGDRLFLFDQNATPFFVKSLSGRHLMFCVPLYETVGVLKAEIYAREEIPPRQQRVIFKGQYLRDDLTLSHYNIEKESTVHLTFVLQGGAGSVHLGRALAYAAARYPWNGDLFYDRNGLQLDRKNAPVVIVEKVDANWYRGRIPGEYHEGIVPSNYVEIAEYLNPDFESNNKSPTSAPFPASPIRHLPPQYEIRDAEIAVGRIQLDENISRPALPAFRYPLRKFYIGFPFADNRESYVSATITYGGLAIPGEPFLVRVELHSVCHHPSRQIASISLSITQRGNVVHDVEPREWVSDQSQEKMKITTIKSSNDSGGGALNLSAIGMAVNKQRKQHNSIELSGDEIPKPLSIRGFLEGDRAHWSIREASGPNYGKGIAGNFDQLSFTLQNWPGDRKFEYRLSVTDTMDGVPVTKSPRSISCQEGHSYWLQSPKLRAKFLPQIW